MLRGYRYALIAVVGWLALAGWAEGHGGGKGNYYKQQAASSQSASPAKTTPLQNPSNAEAEKTPCGPTITENNSDLCQQWRMAEAANQMVQVSWFQVALTGLSLLGLGFTVFFTQKSADAAAKTIAAIHTIERAYVFVAVNVTKIQPFGEST